MLCQRYRQLFHSILWQTFALLASALLAVQSASFRFRAQVELDALSDRAFYDRYSDLVRSGGLVCKSGSQRGHVDG